jgi:hypothetical protein
LYYGRYGSTFYFLDPEPQRPSEILDLFAAAPRIPVSFGPSASFEDYGSFVFLHARWRRSIQAISGLLADHSIHRADRYKVDLTSLTVSGQVQKDGRVVGTICKFDPVLGLTHFAIGDCEYERVIEPA